LRFRSLVRISSSAAKIIILDAAGRRPEVGQNVVIEQAKRERLDAAEEAIFGRYSVS
jgi:hypothetical protein